MNEIYLKSHPEVEIVLKRDDYCCVKCSSTNNIVVHHIDDSRKNGPELINNDPGNLITLCRSCHADIHGITLKFNYPTYFMIRELRFNNKTYKEIGDYLGVSRQRVHQIIKKYNLLLSQAKP